MLYIYLSIRTGPRGGLWPVLLMCNPDSQCPSSGDINRLIIMLMILYVNELEGPAIAFCVRLWKVSKKSWFHMGERKFIFLFFNSEDQKCCKNQKCFEIRELLLPATLAVVSTLEFALGPHSGL
jgi:hypothetical protein